MSGLFNHSWNRRVFLSGMSAAGIASWFNWNHSNENSTEAAEKKSSSSSDLNDVVDSFPLLQNPTENGMSVVWAVKRFATGWVEWGTSKELGKIARPSRFGLYPYNDEFLSVGLDSLEPNTVYYYRTVTIGVDFPRYGQVSLGKEIRSDIYSFVTPGENAKTASFAVMNDTHEVQPTLNALTKRFKQLNPDYILWNGDLTNDVNNYKQVLNGAVKAGNTPYAAEKPLLFVCGNHDHRGPWARNMANVFLPWSQSNPKYRDLGYNYAVRRGPLALIGMDTGEDKPDRHPVWQGLSRFEPYRQLQGLWLEETLNQPNIKSAPFVVVACHIPLFDPDPNSNGGDTIEGFAHWQKECAQCWGPILNKYGVQAVIVAHQHRFEYHKPEGDRKWCQIQGGGTQLVNEKQPNRIATIIQGIVDSDSMTIRAERAADQKELGSWKFSKRS